ncbi:18490_t:CDS:2 [Funneliformis geosporum]|uniref:18490_t:CDS:1 n=1 Tax=Funneliformis geosporum TaxID=1117311 RepID=A0A9W4SCZ6_9GLOM|nr:18490_t:CDS:2 [Funneliformis geosporum]
MAKIMKLFLIFVLVISLVESTLIPRQTENGDACARISVDYKKSKGDPSFSAKYSDVKECLDSIPYNRELAEKIIENVKKTLQGFYVFLSQAKEEPQPGFSFKAVDLIKELDALLLKDYTSDYRFMTDINNLFSELKDAHLNFISLCYNHFIFKQQLYLYSVINKDDIQIIKIFDDEIDHSTVDCEVTHIDGRPSMEVIKEFADTINKSKDAGARFNIALTALKINENGGHNISSSKFTIRNSLPEKSSIDYSLTGVVVIPNVMPSDSDFVNQMFELQKGFKLLEDKGVQKLIFDFNENGGGYVDLALFFVFLLFPNSSPSFHNDMVVSELSRALFDAATSRSIHENSIDTTVITPPPSFSIESLTRWAVDTANEVTDSSSNFDIFAFKDPLADRHFHTVEEFIGNNTFVRGGTPTRYTTKFVDRHSQKINILTKLLAGNFKEYKWMSEDMIILTNGNCGSSCSLITQRMAEMFNVKTVGVGGYKDTPLSYASFPGGMVYLDHALNIELEGLELFKNETLKDSLPSPFNNTVIMSFTLREVYDVNDDRVLEFTYKPAKYRLYYDEQSARDPSKLWLKVAKIFEQ